MSNSLVTRPKQTFIIIPGAKKKNKITNGTKAPINDLLTFLS
jgi:hypothetical protein